MKFAQKQVVSLQKFLQSENMCKYLEQNYIKTLLKIKLRMNALRLGWIFSMVYVKKNKVKGYMHRCIAKKIMTLDKHRILGKLLSLPDFADFIKYNHYLLIPMSQSDYTNSFLILF